MEAALDGLPHLLAGVINDRTAATFAEHEAFLVQTIQPLSVDDTKAALDHWFQPETCGRSGGTRTAARWGTAPCPKGRSGPSGPQARCREQRALLP